MDQTLKSVWVWGFLFCFPQISSLSSLIFLLLFPDNIIPSRQAYHIRKELYFPHGIKKYVHVAVHSLHKMITKSSYKPNVFVTWQNMEWPLFCVTLKALKIRMLLQQACPHVLSAWVFLDVFWFAFLSAVSFSQCIDPFLTCLTDKLLTATNLLPNFSEDLHSEN